MALAALGLFLLEIAAGTSVLLVFWPSRPLGGNFLALHGAIASAALALAIAALPAHLAEMVAASALVLTIACTVLARAGKRGIARPLFAAAGALDLLLIIRFCNTAIPESTIWVSAGSILGALLFGSVLLTMNLGHWYLISRTLPWTLLYRATCTLVVLIFARAALLGAAAVVVPNPDGWASLTSLDRNGLFFLFRLVWGIVGPLGLSYFLFQTAKMKSNQAATGLLYVALVFVLIGEILSAYLTLVTRFPA